MNFAQTKLKIHIYIVGFIAALLVIGSFGCGKSEAQKAAELQAAQRYDARQKIKEAVAAILVRTKGSTYSEFRQSRLDLETCYEANRSSLADVENQFAILIGTMAATDYCWNYSIKAPEIPLPEPHDKQGNLAAAFLRPSITNKLSYTWSQRENDRDFTPAGYVRLGLTKTQEQCDLLLGLLDK